VDTQDHRVDIPCINIRNGNIQYQNAQQVSDAMYSNIFWSPDNDAVIFENRTDAEKTRLVIINLKKNEAYEIGENFQPLGWMRKESN
jgi:hypothetical protein